MISTGLTYSTSPGVSHQSSPSRVATSTSRIVPSSVWTIPVLLTTQVTTFLWRWSISSRACLWWTNKSVWLCQEIPSEVNLHASHTLLMHSQIQSSAWRQGGSQMTIRVSSISFTFAIQRLRVCRCSHQCNMKMKLPRRCLLPKR